ncbi:uncharacterized protein, partial [Clytia hemisphaerica]|uniref:uncharacterized protein n=1 Tax=Clytia hemisphaerica TaxID=252671 RepID=UPI0034D47EAA
WYFNISTTQCVSICYSIRFSVLKYLSPALMISDQRFCLAGIEKTVSGVYKGQCYQPVAFDETGLNLSGRVDVTILCARKLYAQILRFLERSIMSSTGFTLIIFTNLFILTSAIGFTRIESSYYYIGEQNSNFTEARKHCQHLGGDLATINHVE